MFLNVKLDTCLKLDTFFAHRILRVRKKVLCGTRETSRTFSVCCMRGRLLGVSKIRCYSVLGRWVVLSGCCMGKRLLGVPEKRCYAVLGQRSYFSGCCIGKRLLVVAKKVLCGTREMCRTFLDVVWWKRLLCVPEKRCYAALGRRSYFFWMLYGEAAISCFQKKGVKRY